MLCNGAGCVLRGGQLTSNTAGASGGAVYARNSPMLAVQGARAVNNMCRSQGGAVYAFQSSVLLNASRLEGNTAGEAGGALLLSACNTTLIGGCEVVRGQVRVRRCLPGSQGQRIRPWHPAACLSADR